jgi:hypothetical protein
MGIELPTPFPGGNGSPENRDGVFGARGNDMPSSYGETNIHPNNVEKGTANYEPTKENVNGLGRLDNGGQPAYVVANNAPSSQLAAALPLDEPPVVAADEDLIEKVWVDAVKGVITRTSGDPYARSAAIGKLQADYLQKRYGKTVGSE